MLLGALQHAHGTRAKTAWSGERRRVAAVAPAAWVDWAGEQAPLLSHAWRVFSPQAGVEQRRAHAKGCRHSCQGVFLGSLLLSSAAMGWCLVAVSSEDAQRAQASPTLLVHNQHTSFLLRPLFLRSLQLEQHCWVLLLPSKAVA